MRTLRLVVAMALLILALGDPFSAFAQQGWDGCNTYQNSRLVSTWQYGTYCGSTGPGCMFCYTLDGQNYCYTTLPKVCGPFAKAIDGFF